MPTFTCRGSSARKALAAFWAATRRLGSTSVARMLPETSMASMMVSCCEGRAMVAKGRAEASNSAASASKNSRGGRWRRQEALPAMAWRTRARLA